MIYFTSNKGIEFIKSFEAFRPKSYICPGGFRTIGYGHILDKAESYKTITMLDAIELLKMDVAKAEKAVIRNITTLIAQNQFDALVSFTFNVGSGALQRSTLRQKINYGSSSYEIGEEFLRWTYANGRRLSGLLRRRMMEARIYTATNKLNHSNHVHL